MIKRWSSFLTHPLLLSFIISILVVFLFARYLPRYYTELQEESSLTNNGEVYYYDLDGDGNSEKLHYYQYDRIFQPTLYLYDSEGNFKSLWSFQELPVKQSKLFAGDYDLDGNKEIYLFTSNPDSLFLHILNPKNDKENIINRYLVATGSFMANDLEVKPLGLYNLNYPGNKEFLFAVDAGYLNKPVKIFSFNIPNKNLASSPELTIDIEEPLIVEDVNNDNKTEIILSNNSLNLKGNGSAARLVILKNTLEYLFPPVIFYGNTSKVTASVISNDGNKNIAVLHSGKSSQNIFNHLMLFSFEGKLLNERTINEKTNLELIKSSADKSHIYLFSGTKILKYTSELTKEHTYNISSSISDFIGCADVIGDPAKELLFKSKDEFILVSGNLRSKVKLAAPDRGRIITSLVKNNKVKHNQLSLQINQKWYLFDLYKNENFFYSHIFYFLIFIVILSVVFTISKIKSIVSSRKRSDQQSIDFLSDIEENIEKRLTSLRSTVKEISGNKDDQSYQRIEKEIDYALEEVKTISDYRRQKNTLKDELFKIIEKSQNAENLHLNIYPEDEIEEIEADTKNMMVEFTESCLNALNKIIKNNPVDIQIVIHQKYIHLLIEVEDTIISGDEILKNPEIRAVVDKATVKSEVEIYSNTGTIISTTFTFHKDKEQPVKQDNRIKVIIAEDHDVSLFGLISMFKTKDDIELVGTAKNGMEVLKLLETKTTDIVITDISMPGMDGIELSEQLKNNYPQIKVIVFTMYMENWFVEQLMNNGAKGFVSKNSKMVELIGAVRSVYEGDNYYCLQFKSKFGFKVSSGNGGIQKKLDSLTKNELQIIKHYADNYTKDQIAVQMKLNNNTMDTFVANILLKLNAGDENEIIRIAKKQKFISQ